MPQIGYQWLSNTYGVVPVHPFAVQSEIGRIRSTSTDGDIRREVYPERYRPAASLIDNLTFAFRHEGIHLEFLARLYALQPVRHELEAWIAREPTGAYARRACFFYEWLMPKPLDAPGVSRGNYVDALNPDDFIVGTTVNNARWRVRDNLPGNRDFCPVIRRVEAVQRAEAYDLAAPLAELEAAYGIDLILRSAVWLTVKESRASFLIEHEQDKEDRIRRFAAVMESECGQHANPFDAETLDVLQRGILGQSALRYGIRPSPVYVGHIARYQPVVDYIAPPWESIEPMLLGLARFLERTEGGAPIIRAAATSFGFVYVRPMADGNGRISRFLINDILRRDGAVPAPIILPVSATITHSTRDRAAYDKVLERFSRPLMKHYADQYTFGKTEIADDGVEYNLHFRAYDDALPAWRYPDLTAHVIYLADVIDMTLTHEMRTEARFLHANDSARCAIKDFLEAPDNDLDGIIRSVRQNGNSVSNNLRKRYPLFDERPELSAQIVQAITDAFSDENNR
ncbi:Fic/DOC family protein [Paraburkholderia sp. BL23I1N1]|uniref:Fic family protein n=1 Tax=Paraburkholderia sp. BL23I1N1 TaxID=1938802 RepID=UPI000E736109|nr:Fic family protein [Paraburkholderia sp. BL23I1N1]RKE37714.1 Fic/DOC family protein [Paraburkholderia sp. BL23I1N1]